MGGGEKEGEVRIMIWLYFAAVATAIIAIIGWLIHKDAELWVKGVIIFLVVVALAAQIVIFRAEIKEKEASRYAGVL